MRPSPLACTYDLCQSNRLPCYLVQFAITSMHHARYALDSASNYLRCWDLCRQRKYADFVQQVSLILQAWRLAKALCVPNDQSTHPLAVWVQTPHWSLSGKASSMDFGARLRANMLYAFSHLTVYCTAYRVLARARFRRARSARAYTSSEQTFN